MNLFEKRTTFVGNIAYMGVMAAINVVFVLLTLLIPGSFFFVFFFLSLSSAIVSVFCWKKYYCLYLLATLAICLPINFADALFYVFPALVTGFVFGLFYVYGISPLLLMISLTIVQMGFTYLSIPIIEAITKHDLTYDIAKVFGVQTHEYLNYIKHIFIIVISFIQQLFAFIIIYSQIGRFKNEEKLFKHNDVIEFGFGFFAIAMSLLFIPIFSEFIYVFLLFAVIVAVKVLVDLLMKKVTWVYIALGSSFVVFFFLFAGIYHYINKPYGLLLIDIYLFAVLIIGFINNCLLNKSNNNTISNKHD